MLDVTKVGKRLRKLRGERTIQKVSNDTGLGVSALTMYELGKRMPRDEAKVVLSKYYNVTIDELFFNKKVSRNEIKREAG